MSAREDDVETTDLETDEELPDEEELEDGA
jgi:hypothetical protein